jgi:nucleotide-binding universal stress UspA family protein
LLDYAVDFARSFDARVVALHVSARLRLKATPPLLSYLDALDELKFTVDEELTHLRSVFESANTRQGFKGEFACLTARRTAPSAIVTTRARAADLVIASQADPHWPLSPLLDCADEIVLGSGRPVVVVPNDWACTAPPRTIVVAWNQSREASRAMFEALPLLKRAAAVELLQIEKAGIDAPNPEETALATTTVIEALAEHGIKASLSIGQAQGEDVGLLICRHATNRGADLIVMGCYGRTRLREMVFGGATRHMLRHMPVPVLFSH